MNDESRNSVVSQDELVYPSKRDTWIVGALWLVIIASVAGAIAAFSLSLSVISLLIQEAVWLGIIAFCVSILRSTNYTIKADSLLIRSGPFRWTVPFDDIEEVIPSRKAWSSAALSMDRLYVKHKGSAGGSYISPENKQEFLEKLAARAPALRLEENRLVRI